MSIQIDELVWHEELIRHITRHGGTMRRCREIKDGAPKFFEQDRSRERRGTHQMIGPDTRGRFWTVVIEYLGNGQAIPLTMWPSRPGQIRKYEEAD